MTETGYTMTKKYFITIEGVEGAGKSTVIKILEKYLQEKNIPLTMTREPGGTEIAEAIRRVLLDFQYEEKMTKDTELLLMFASRAQHIAQIIKPALAKNHVVLCDRFTDASFAYQGAGRGISEERIESLAKWVQGDFWPDLTILLDLPIEVGFERIKERGAKDRIEEEIKDFFRRVRQSYLDRAAKYPNRFVVVDASQPLEKVEKQLIKILTEKYFNQ